MEIKNANEQVFVNSLRAKVNGKTTSIIDAYSSWLIGGFGVACTLFVSQYESIEDHVKPYGIQWFLGLFVLALLLAIIQKFIVVMVSNNSVGTEVGAELAKELKENKVVLDFEFIFSEIETSTLSIFRGYVSRTLAKSGKETSSLLPVLSRVFAKYKF